MMDNNSQMWPDPREPRSFQEWAKIPFAEGVARWRAVFRAAAPEAIGEGVAASVVIPVYNAAPYLPQMLISLAAQTLANIEIICVDDGSTDASLAVCRAFAAHDPRIRVLSQTNQGAAVARNNGLLAAVGRWVFFADADDFCHPAMLADMVAEGERGADVVVAGRHYVDFQGRHDGIERKIPKGYFRLGETVTCETEGFDMFAGIGVVVWNKLFRRQFLLEAGLRFSRLPTSNDMNFVVRSLLRARRIRLLPKAYYYYRSENPASIVGGMDRYPTVFLEAWNEAGREISSRSVRLQEQFYKAAVQVSFWHLTRVKSVAGMQAVYRALCDGGLIAMKGDAVDDGALDLGLLRDAYDALMRREPLELVMLALFSAHRVKLDVACQDVRKTKSKVVALKRSQVAMKEVVARLESKVQALTESNAALERQLSGIKRSLSYRLGRWATAPFRRLKKLGRRTD